MYPSTGQGGCSTTGNTGGATAIDTPTCANEDETESAAHSSAAKAKERNFITLDITLHETQVSHLYPTNQIELSEVAKGDRHVFDISTSLFTDRTCRRGRDCAPALR